MTSEGSGPTDADAITRYITESYPETVIAYAESRDVLLTRRVALKLATIVTGEAFDDGSEPVASRRLSAEHRCAVARDVPAPRRRSLRTRTSPSWTACSPTRVYAKQRWVAILNPSARSFEEIVKPLLAETHERVAAQQSRSA